MWHIDQIANPSRTSVVREQRLLPPLEEYEIECFLRTQVSGG